MSKPKRNQTNIFNKLDNYIYKCSEGIHVSTNAEYDPNIDSNNQS